MSVRPGRWRQKPPKPAQRLSLAHASDHLLRDLGLPPHIEFTSKPSDIGCFYNQSQERREEEEVAQVRPRRTAVMRLRRAWAMILP